MNDPRFEVYPERRWREPNVTQDSKGEPTGEWGWRFVDANGRRTFIGGEGFDSVYNAHRALWGACFDVIRIFLGQTVGLSPSGIPVRVFDVDGTYEDVRLYEGPGGELAIDRERDRRTAD